MSAHDPEDSAFLALQDLKGRLRARADRAFCAALMVAIDQDHGYRPAESQARHGLSADEFALAHRWAREELGHMRDQAA